MLAPRLLVVLLGIAVSSTVLANGRFPASRGVSAQADSWMVPVTFGMLVSNDGGSSFYWLCEDALGYGGTYDPDHLVDAQGDRWITSFDGIRVSRDGGCTWNAVGAPFDTLFPGALTMDSAGRLWVVTAQAGVDNGAYRNDDSSGAVFGALGLSSPEGLFTSIAVAPSLTSRAYVAGFVIGELGLPEPLLLSTNDDGASWDPLPVDAFDLGDQPTLEVRAVSQADPDVVFVSVGRTPENGGDVLYRSVDGGQSFAEALTMVGGIEAVLARANGEIVVGAGAQGTWVSANAGQSFEQVEGGPLLSCVYERADGSLLGCGSNVAPDPLAIGSSSDGRSWDSVLTFDAIAGPLECEAGTPQRDSCAELWPGLVEQLGIGGDQPDAG
ncbi:MAG: hypothetical protein KJO07_21070, partial [Deltaproteobacteria bacterium]|nr:hypothetical protein [Deltaproteobacteria bacterium]